MKDKFEPIPDPTPEQGFEGLYAGTIESRPTEEILKMFEM